MSRKAIPLRQWLALGVALVLTGGTLAQEQASIMVVDGDAVQIEGQLIPADFAREKMPLNAEQIVVPANTALMAYFPSEAAKVVLIVVGPAGLAIKGEEITLRTGTLMLSGDAPTEQQRVALLLEDGAGKKSVLCRALPRGDLYVHWDGQATLDVAFDGGGTPDRMADMLVAGGPRVLASGQRLIQRGTAVETGDAAGWLAQRKLDDVEMTGMRLSLRAAKETRAQRQYDLFSTVIGWDRSAQSELVRTSEKGQALGLQRFEPRQSPAVAAPRSPQTGLSSPAGRVTATNAQALSRNAARQLPFSIHPATLNQARGSSSGTSVAQ